MEKFQKAVRTCTKAKVAIPEIDLYGYVTEAIAAGDPSFAELLKNSLADSSTEVRQKPFTYIANKIKNMYSERTADSLPGHSMAAMSAQLALAKKCQICGKSGHTALKCKSRKASAEKQRVVLGLVSIAPAFVTQKTVFIK